MLSNVTKKIAKEYNLRITRAMAYGEIDGYLFTLYEENAVRLICVSAAFENDNDRNAAHIALTKPEFTKEYKVARAEFDGQAFRFMFINIMGIKKHIQALIAQLPGKLREYRTLSEGHCAFCAAPLGMDCTNIALHGVAMRAHESCVLAKEQEFNVLREEYAAEKKHIGRGLIGALLGGLIGSIPWIIAYNLGWFVGWFGFLIGLGAKKGYELFGGKPCRTKTWIVMLITILCVGIGLIASCVVMLYIQFGAYGLTLAEALEGTIYLFEDAEFVGAFLFDYAIGLVFALLGTLGMLHEMRKEHNSRAQAPLKRLDMI